MLLIAAAVLMMQVIIDTHPQWFATAAERADLRLLAHRRELDEPFEAVDPVSARVLRALLRRFVAGGGSVVISSHVMSLVEELCDRVAIIARGAVLAAGTLDEVRGGASLEDVFVRHVGERTVGAEELRWL